MKNKDVPVGKLKRTAVTGSAMAKLGVKHLTYLGKKTFSEQDQIEHERQLGKTLFAALSQLRGTALKVSQVLSMEADLLPVHIREELAKGCYQVPPLNRALIHKVFVQEFNQAPGELFDQFNRHAFAAASLGQVHQASLANGKSVAVKVQYPGIASSINSDVKILRGVMTTLAKTTDLLPDKQLVNRVLDEIEARLLEEVDYEFEAEKTLWFKQQLAPLNVQVPEVYSDFSSDRVITTAFLQGLHLDEWLAGNPSQSQRNQVGQQLFDLFFYSLFKLNRLHADPHPGNFLFLPDGTIGLIDFGCVKAIDPAFPPQVAKTMSGLLPNGDADSLLNTYKNLNMLAPDLSIDEFNQDVMPHLKPMHDWLIQPFLQPEFDFATKSPYPIKAIDNGKKAIAYLTGFHPDQIYFDRAFLGLMNMLHKIKSVVKTQNSHLIQEF